MGDPNTVNMRTCFALLVITAAQYTFAAAPPSKLFTCFNNTCVLLDRGSTQGSSLAVCLLTCGAGPVWPLPSKSAMDGNVSAFSRCSIHMQRELHPADRATAEILRLHCRDSCTVSSLRV